MSSPTARRQMNSSKTHPRRRPRAPAVRRGAAVVFLALLTLAGCGRPAGVIFEPLTDAPQWPSPPEPPRIRYLGQLAIDEDLKPAKSFLELTGEALFGEDTVHSMLSPYAVCTDGGDRLFVADSNGQVVHVLNLNTREYSQWRPAENSRAAKRFSQPVGIAYDPAGRLIVADSAAGALFVFDDSGQVVDVLGEEHLSRPCGLAVDPATRRIFVADPGTHHVIVLAADGALLGMLGGRGTGAGQFNFPTNVVIDSQGRLYVSDSLNFRVQQFDRDLKPLRQIGSKGDLPGYFSQPKGLAVDSDDHLYIVDAHFEVVQIFNAEGQLLLAFGEEGRGLGQFWLPAGIHIDAHDRIWIADTYNQRVQVFTYLSEVAR